MRVNYAIVFVSDMKRSVSFYWDVLGLPLKFESAEWTEFSTEGATIALHKTESRNPDQMNQQQTVAGRWRPGFSVPNPYQCHSRKGED